jgi:hypothetical protein
MFGIDTSVQLASWYFVHKYCPIYGRSYYRGFSVNPEFKNFQVNQMGDVKENP